MADKGHMKTALIVGGGISGCAAAMALREVGVESTVFEARPEPSGGIGTFLTVATNGIDALRAIGADAAVLERSFPTSEIVLRSGSGKSLGRVPTGVPLEDGTPSQTIRREDFRAALADEASARGVAVEYGRRLVDAYPDGDRVRAVFADGGAATGDMLIGADGVNSAVRRLVDPMARSPRYEGLLNAGGHAVSVGVAVPVGSYEMVFGRRAFFGYVPAPDGETWWFANLPRRQEPPKEELRRMTPAVLRESLLEAFADDSGPACELIRATAELQPLTAIHTMPRLPTWHRGRTLLIGDAAHAASPTSGQGASLGIEDAVALAWAIRRSDRIPIAFARFEEDRRPRVERIVRRASRVNNSKTAGPIGRAVRDAVMPVMMRAMAGRRSMRMPFEHHLEPLVRP